MRKKEWGMTMKWSNEPPRDGNYDIWLWRENASADAWPFVIFWATERIDGEWKKILVAQADFESERVRVVKKMGGQWAGPVQQPEE